MSRQKVIIMGAGGRDFHNFNMLYRENPEHEVVAFTAAQIPYIETRTYPPELAGALYPKGIPIHPEEKLGSLISAHQGIQVVFAYSDVSHEYVMHKASYCLSQGADFLLPGPERTMIRSTLPVVSVCAVRTGCGKSIITRKLAGLFKTKGVPVSVIRHPMAYCDFIPVKKFSTIDDIDRGACTIEEREEFEPLVEKAVTVFAGVDYRKVVDEAQKESRVIIWDGGNNDFPFLLPQLEIVLLDALRPGHETLFYPGEVNLKRADVLIITKAKEAKEDDREQIRKTILKENPDAEVFETSSVFSLSNCDAIKDKRALVIEDGPTITHGGMPSGAGVSAVKGIVSSLVDPRQYAVGSIKETYARFPHIGPVLPAMGYSAAQIGELEETIAKTPSDVIIVATPVDLTRIIRTEKPVARVFYDFDINLERIVDAFQKSYVL